MAASVTVTNPGLPWREAEAWHHVAGSVTEGSPEEVTGRGKARV